jgi:hypothetical protein
MGCSEHSNIILNSQTFRVVYEKKIHCISGIHKVEGRNFLTMALIFSWIFKDFDVIFAYSELVM